MMFQMAHLPGVHGTDEGEAATPNWPTTCRLTHEMQWHTKVSHVTSVQLSLTNFLDVCVTVMIRTHSSLEYGPTPKMELMLNMPCGVLYTYELLYWKENEKYFWNSLPRWLEQTVCWLHDLGLATEVAGKQLISEDKWASEGTWRILWGCESWIGTEVCESLDSAPYMET